MHKPSYDELDVIASKNGWYTRDNHPPFPFLAIVHDDDDELKRCDDQGEYADGDCKHRHTVRLIWKINEEFLYPGRKSALGPFGHNFARPYKGPVNGLLELNTIHVDMRPVPAQVVETPRRGLSGNMRAFLRLDG